MLALKVGAEMPGADLMKATGNRANPAAVYRTYINVPIVMSSPRANVKARSPSADINSAAIPYHLCRGKHTILSI